MSAGPARAGPWPLVAGLGAGLFAALAWILLSPLLPAPSPAKPKPVAALSTSKGFAVFPGSIQLDSATGLHVTGEAPTIDVAAWRLSVSGKVRRPLAFDLNELRRLPRLATEEPIICEGYFEDHAHWAGASLVALLDRAGVEGGATTLSLVAADGYESSVSLAEARSGSALIAYEWEGRALPVLHGYPVRAAFPGLPGNRWVKWLVEMRVE